MKQTDKELTIETGYDFTDGAKRRQHINGKVYHIVNGSLFVGVNNVWDVIAEIIWTDDYSFCSAAGDRIINKIGATVQLQDSFTDRQLQLIKQNDLVAPSGYPVIYANEYQGKIYLTNLMDVVLQVIPKEVA